jgi:predicted PurR-regulated permease PerM
MLPLSHKNKQRLLGAAVGLFIIVLFWKLQTVATLFILSLLVAYILNPVATRLERLRFINRTAAAVVTLFGLTIGFLAVMFVIVPDVIREFRSFQGRFPDRISRLIESVADWVAFNLGFTVPRSVEETFERFGEELGDIIPEIIGPATNIAARVFGGTFSVVLAVVAGLMFPLFLFFLLKDFPRLVKSVDDLLPRSTKHKWHGLAREVDASLSDFLHGQFMVMLVLGTLYSVGYTIVGIPVAVGVGLLTGMLCFIPYVGAATGFVMALLLAVLEFKGIGSVVGVVLVFAGVQTLDAALITPRILGGQLGLRPLWIIVALMAGAELFSFLGVLLAVPTTAVLKVLVHHTLLRYRASSFYRGEAEPPRALPPRPDEDANAPPTEPEP